MIRRRRVRVALVCVVISLLTGCVNAQTNAFWGNDAGYDIGNDEGAQTVASMHRYAEWLRELSTSERKDVLDELEQNVDQSTDQSASFEERLRLALLLSGIDPVLVDYGRARELLRGCLTETSSALLTSYIRSLLEIVRLEEIYIEKQQAYAEKKRVVEQLNAERHKVKQLENKLSALEEQLMVKQNKVRALEMRIEDKESRIEILEAKLEAMVFIEQSISSRKETPMEGELTEIPSPQEEGSGTFVKP